MRVNGTLINYYFHCKRQCYLSGNRLNMEDNSELVNIGKAIHEERAKEKGTEIEIENIKIDKLSKDYVTEVKKSDADIEAAKWQLLYYLKVLKEKGVLRKGKIEVLEKNKINRSIIVVELGEKEEQELEIYVQEIEKLINSNVIPKRLNKSSCKKCSYYEYCYI